MPGIVVIGASQGGVQALMTIVAGLGADFPVPIAVVLHIGASRSVLPSLLNRPEGLTAGFAHDGEAMVPGTIYIAPPDHHLLVGPGFLELSRSPRENWARPAIDPLFRSAAAAYGPGVIGVVLTGLLNDGTAGLYEIKRQGGVAVVQTPSGAEAPGMPKSALENVAIDYCLPLNEMPRLLTRLAGETLQDTGSTIHGSEPMEQAETLQNPVAQTCPECGGAMRKESTGQLSRFRCHIGHVMTGEVLASTQVQQLEYNISAVRRLLNERAALCRDMADKLLASGNTAAAEAWLHAADETDGQTAAAQQLVDQDWSRPELA